MTNTSGRNPESPYYLASERGTTGRKRHNGDAGYIAERMNPFASGQKVVIYRAAEQGIDVGTDKYAIVCDAHATICGTTNLPDARVLMKNPDNFCEACREIGSRSEE
jgi:hypothetical protein